MLGYDITEWMHEMIKVCESKSKSDQTALPGWLGNDINIRDAKCDIACKIRELLASIDQSDSFVIDYFETCYKAFDEDRAFFIWYSAPDDMSASGLRRGLDLAESIDLDKKLTEAFGRSMSIGVVSAEYYY